MQHESVIFPVIIEGKRRGFALLELLVVIAVLVAMLTMVVPAVGSLFQSRGRAAALADLEAGVELARTYARTGKGYAWMAIMNGERDGRPGVFFTIFSSRDGSTRVDAANVRAVTAAKFLPDVTLASLGELEQGVVAGVPPAAVDVTREAGMFPVSGGSVNYSQGEKSYTLIFAPGGEVLLPMAPTPATPYDQYLALPIAAKNGGGVRSPKLDAVLLIEGGSGQVRRIQL